MKTIHTVNGKKVGASVKLTATTAGGTAYEVRIYKKSGTKWTKVVTAALVSPGTYVADLEAKVKGTLRLKAAFVNSSGTVKAWSSPISIKVT